ncbi:GA4 desaturase [Metarhizium album ARSEF 1941]|uniref:GA4 desaturase n=1 Tax=Metarhizium album (strain ARSEF 1941) TaxID=1081103 RepID=A0A0B2WW88_METAS|nr:GA4 desaturase [Metarhizium album ARSEF 1941]KHO00462.1 GA4 desaturase [Metarhizium album ARSEF 1941]
MDLANGTAQVLGQYMHPVVDRDKSERGDPWQRNYGAPPPVGELVPRTSPLIDIRPLLSDPRYTVVGHLESHGFGVVKHRSAALQACYTDEGEVDEEAVASVYYPEVKELVMQALGAKSVHVTHSVFRKGASAPEPFRMPTGLKPLTPSASAAALTTKPDHGQEAAARPAAPGRPAEQARQAKPASYWTSRPRMSTSTPARVPHLDFTPLSARRTLRHQSRDIFEAAVERGMIAAEDGICQNHPFQPSAKESDALIAEQYNHAGTGQLGPRYAAYSIWRPLRTVARDPLTFSPRREVPASAVGNMVHWQYENKVPGPPELGGDWLKEFAMLGVTAREEPAEQSVSPEGARPEWFYLSAQEPDEVLFVQLFDSASLGETSQHAGAPWHASPEIGAAAGPEPRQSIDVRVVVFW